MYIMVAQEGSGKETLQRPIRKEWDALPQDEALKMYHNLRRKGANQIVNLTANDLSNMRESGCFNLKDEMLEKVESLIGLIRGELISPQNGHMGFDSPFLKLVFEPEKQGAMPIEKVVYMAGIGIDVGKLADFMCPWTKQG